MTEYISLKDASERFHVSYWTLRYLASSNKVPSQRKSLGKGRHSILLELSPLEAYLASAKQNKLLIDRFDAASILGIGPRDVQKLASKNKIPFERATRIGRGQDSHRLYPRDTIEKLAAENKRPISIPDNFGYYLSGITDGEGSFNILVRKSSKGYSLESSFKISLRDDDANIILLIRDTLGFGYIRLTRNSNSHSKPSVSFETSRHSDSLRLVEVFDKYPLQAKKKRDYSIWREFVLERSKPKPDIQKLISLSNEIVNVRKYKPLDREVLDKIALSRSEYFHIRKVSSY